MAYIEHEIHYQRAPQQIQHINEQGEREERKMSLNALLNSEGGYEQEDKISIKSEESGECNIMNDSRSPSPSSSPPPYSGALVPIQSTPPPSSSAVASVSSSLSSSLSSSSSSSASSSANRATCHICRFESGRCHASDPATMQAFFANTLGFDGTLNTSDWLCMKCYSKWYNRCKRKAASSTSSSAAVDNSGLHTPSKRRRRDKDTYARKREERLSDAEKDTDSDDALLLARMVQHHAPQFSPLTTPQYSPVSTPLLACSATGVNSEDFRDSEMEVDGLREEVRAMRSQLARFVQEQAKRDEQMENLLTFVKTEFSAMHDLFREMTEGRWGPATVPQTRSYIEGFPNRVRAEEFRGCEA